MLLGMISGGGITASAAPIGVPPGASSTPGTVIAWGANTYGQVTVPSQLGGATAIAAGLAHSLALKSDGTVLAWGMNWVGQSTVPSGLSGVTAIAAGNTHSMALRSDGTVIVWGDVIFFGVPAGLSGVTAIAAGYYHSLALKSDGTVTAWGPDAEGQTVPSQLSGVTAIAAGLAHSLALKSDGTVVAWGSSSDGASSVPSGLSGVTAIAAGLAHSLALKSDGTVVAWGANHAGESSVPSGLSGVTAIAAGGNWSLALKSDGTVVAWGAYGAGESSVPSGLSGVTAIAAGGSHFLALTPTDQNGNAVVKLANDTPCQDFVFLGVRGSGEQATDGDFGMGERVTAMYNSFIGSMRNSRIAVAGVDYLANAVPISIVRSDWHNYFLSIDIGVDATETALFRRVSLRCPNEQFVLAGYSQGAMVLHRMVFDLSRGPSGGLYDFVLSKIAAVGTMGDGDRVAQDNVVELGTSPTTVNNFGVGVAFGGAGAAYTSTKMLMSNVGHGLNARWFQVCDDYDIVCDFGKVTSNWRETSGAMIAGYQVHIGSYTEKNHRLVEAGQRIAQASTIFAANAAPSTYAATPSATPAPPPATPPAADSASISALLVANRVDVTAATNSFVAASASSRPGSVDFNKPFSGSMPWAGNENFVDVYAYSAPVYRGAFPVVDGRVILRNLDLSQLGAGSHQLVLVGQTSKALSAIELGATSSRISGTDRYATAIAIAKAGYPSTAPVVYVATGRNFPDALAAAPAAALLGGPLLLTPGDSLPATVADAIKILKPTRIVVVGGRGAISDQVQTQLASLAATVDRIAGSDRYETARLVVEDAFESSPDAPVTSAYLATGRNFPDALSAAAAAGAKGIPVLLVDGGASTIDSKTLALISKLGITKVTIAGGTGVVSPGIESSLSTAGLTVERQGGSDRFATSQLLSAKAFPSGAPQVFLATGYQFPDALAGAVLAGQKRSPLYVVPTNCVPKQVSIDIAASGASGVTLLGGPGALNETVLHLQPCS